jgi:aminoglycoside phosphotransferase (APT) family kinase protein
MAGDMPGGIEADRVTAWIVERDPTVRPPLRFERFAGGRSNLTYLVTDRRGRSLVLRRPPLHSVLKGAHDMAREYRIIAALGPTAVGVPPVAGLCEDSSVTGAPFYVMGFVDGIVLRDAAQAETLEEDVRRHAAESLVDTLVALHALDPVEVGLAGLGATQDYVARQLHTWMRQLQHTGGGDLPGLEEAQRRLAARIPRQQRSAIVHGDYRLDNVILARDGEVVAVVDWELCTLGDPLADLGLLLVYWGEAGDAFTALPAAPSVLAGFPDRAALAARYAAGAGLDLGDLDYYVAFGYWKLAAVLQGVYSRARAGAYGEAGEAFEGIGERVALLAEAAVDRVRGAR